MRSAGRLDQEKHNIILDMHSPTDSAIDMQTSCTYSRASGGSATLTRSRSNSSFTTLFVEDSVLEVPFMVSPPFLL